MTSSMYLFKRKFRIVSFFLLLLCWSFHILSFHQRSNNSDINNNSDLIAKGSQYTLTLTSRRGHVTQAVQEVSSVKLSDLPDLQEFIQNVNIQKQQQDDKNNNPQLRDKQNIQSILHAAGINKLDKKLLQLLPTDQRIAYLYGNRTHVVQNTETCQRYRDLVPPHKRIVGVAGMYNTGTTALALYLQANLHSPAVNWTDLMQEYQYQHMWEVPWGKHRLLHLQDDFTNAGAENLFKSHVLPVVIVRDPYSWLQSMCTSPYNARWKHSKQHCPNLVVNSDDKRAFPKSFRVGQTVPAKLASQPGAYYHSLGHLYRDWYGAYRNSTIPHLRVRFEDLLLRPDLVLREIKECVNGTFLQKQFVYVVGASKWSHQHIKAQSNRISAVVKYGNGWKRLNNMTVEDIELVDDVLGDLMKEFDYRDGKEMMQMR